PAAALDDTAAVRSYKSLSLVERAFRCIKTVDLQIRPVYHWLADRVRAHVFVCMLDRKSTRLNSSHSQISYAVFCLKKKNSQRQIRPCHNYSCPTRVTLI